MFAGCHLNASKVGFQYVALNLSSQHIINSVDALDELDKLDEELELVEELELELAKHRDRKATAKWAIELLTSGRYKR